MQITENTKQMEGFQKTVESLSQSGYDRPARIPKDLSESDLILSMTERDLYPGEIKSFILEILRNKMTNVHGNSRIYHILDDLVTHNEDSSDYRLDINYSVEQLFRNYHEWTERIENELSRLGFDVIARSNHMKIRFCGDNRYVITLAKTPSDRRAGLNIISDIRKKIFGLTE